MRLCLWRVYENGTEYQLGSKPWQTVPGFYGWLTSFILQDTSERVLLLQPPWPMFTKELLQIETSTMLVSMIMCLSGVGRFAPYSNQIGLIAFCGHDCLHKHHWMKKSAFVSGVVDGLHSFPVPWTSDKKQLCWNWILSALCIINQSTQNKNKSSPFFLHAIIGCYKWLWICWFGTSWCQACILKKFGTGFSLLEYAWAKGSSFAPHQVPCWKDPFTWISFAESSFCAGENRSWKDPFVIWEDGST